MQRRAEITAYLLMFNFPTFQTVDFLLQIIVLPIHGNYAVSTAEHRVPLPPVEDDAEFESEEEEEEEHHSEGAVEEVVATETHRAESEPEHSHGSEAHSSSGDSSESNDSESDSAGKLHDVSVRLHTKNVAQTIVYICCSLCLISGDINNWRKQDKCFLYKYVVCA